MLGLPVDSARQPLRLAVDGSVHFLNAGISIRILARLVTRAGGEVVAGGDYGT